MKKRRKPRHFRQRRPYRLAWRQRFSLKFAGGIIQDVHFYSARTEREFGARLIREGL